MLIKAEHYREVIIEKWSMPDKGNCSEFSAKMWFNNRKNNLPSLEVDNLLVYRDKLSNIKKIRILPSHDSEYINTLIEQLQKDFKSALIIIP